MRVRKPVAKAPAAALAALSQLAGPRAVTEQPQQQRKKVGLPWLSSISRLSVGILPKAAGNHGMRQLIEHSCS